MTFTEAYSLNFSSVQSIFEQFGHALQHILTKQDEGLVAENVAGKRNIEQDASTFAYHFMGNWCYHRETLMGIAMHYETGESLPEGIYLKLLAGRTFLADFLSLRQTKESHREYKFSLEFLKTMSSVNFIIYLQLYLQLGTTVTRYMRSFIVELILASQWAEVLSVDAFSAFEDAGLEDIKALKETGIRFRETILALGGGKAQLEVFVQFRVREPSPEALLRYSGLLSATASA